ncbi:DNA excision repair protein ERCC-6-like 2 [Lepisosteus oculatus]|uniref:DNA excision repair protein ERCC-6-like 2 n=1 Tax=Lepisosteus oculatus TaxID=7918 RepID=UPI00370FAA20
MASGLSPQSDNTKLSWHVGDRCLAPCSSEGSLCAGTIKKLVSIDEDESVAVVKFFKYDEETVPVTKLQVLQSPLPYKSKRTSVFGGEDLEKPLFHNRKLPGAAVPYKLSENGDNIPYTINRYLRDYQREGVKFIYSHYRKGRGCVLGDDMGLGKTIQVISFLAAVLHKKGTREDIEKNVPEFLLSDEQKPKTQKSKKIFLIVAPLSLLYNWKDEFDTWGYFRVTILHGTKKEEELARVKKGKCEFALTTYETLRLYLDDFNSIDWSAVIVDEAHKIKNPNSQITQAMKELKCRVRVGLTGTILQNNMEELWCVMDWALPGCLGSLSHFRSMFADPIEKGQKHSATKRELAVGRKAVRRLAKKLSQWFLRRTKSLISNQLPKKDDRVVYCSLTEFQQAVYQAVLESEDVSLLLSSGRPCTCNSGLQRKRCCFKKTRKGVSMRALYFSYLTILRKVANHVALLQSKGNTSKQQEEYVNDICEDVFKKFPDFIQRSKEAAFETISDPKYSGKMKVLQQLLNHCLMNKDKVLLFSLSTKLLDVLESYCMAEGIEYRRLDGNTKSVDRVRTVKEFNSTQDINICLVSTMAGGVGLNFVGANVVVLFDPTWNPANDLQAIDRAYRIGQCRDVKVFRLISLGTVEEVIYLRQVYKQQLQCAVVGNENAKRYFEAVQGPEGFSGELFGMKNLFRFKTGGNCLTRQILERDGRVEAGVMTAVTQMREKLETSSGLYSYPSKYVPMELGNGGRDPKLAKDILDLSSDSEDERENKSRPESGEEGEPSSATPCQLSLFHFGFSQFLEGSAADKGESSEGDASSDLEDAEEGCTVDVTPEKGNTHSCLPTGQTSEWEPQKPYARENWTLSSDSEESVDLGNKPRHLRRTRVATEENSSDESDDVISPFGRVVDDRKDMAKRRTQMGFLPGTSKDYETDKFPTRSSLVSCNKRGKWKSGCDYDSSESDDVEVSRLQSVNKTRINQAVRGRSTVSKKNQKFVQFINENDKPEDIETEVQRIENFTSSEDEVPVKKSKPNKELKKSKVNLSSDPLSRSKGPLKTSEARLTFQKPKSAFVKRTSFNEKDTFKTAAILGSMDRLLDGFQEVAYTHSNQRIVGSSKAENRMSHSALRDVFDLKKYSQVPANRVSDSTQILSDQRQGTPAQARQKAHGDLSPWDIQVEHPVTQTLRRVHRTGHTTFLIGETPQAVCRKQLIEMGSFFKAASVEELAERIVRSTSESRQIMLRDFYSSQYPELKTILTITRQGPAVSSKTTHSGSSGKQNPTSRRHKKSKSESGVPEISGSGVKGLRKCAPPTKKFCFVSQTSEDSDTSLKQSEGRCSSSASSHLIQDLFFTQDSGESRALFDMKQKPSRKSSGCLPVKAKRRPNSSPPPSPADTCTSRRQESVSSQKDLITELLGDTSILDDIFKTHSTKSESLRHSASGHVKKARSRSKDVWDILNEENEESMNKLTDLSVVERMCEGVNVAAKNKDLNQDSQLWKKNDNFLWKK